MATWLTKNNLVANLKRAKTGCVLFSMHQRTQRSKPQEIEIFERSITESKNYESLGVTFMERRLHKNNINYVYVT